MIRPQLSVLVGENCLKCQNPSMTLEIDAQGRVVLSAALRESLRLHAGNSLNARLGDG